MEKGEPEPQDKSDVNGSKTDVKSANTPKQSFRDQQPSISQEPKVISRSESSPIQLETAGGEILGKALKEFKPEKEEEVTLYSLKCTQTDLPPQEPAQSNGTSTDNPLVERRKNSVLPPDEDPSTSSESTASSPSYFDEGMGGFTDEFAESSGEDLNDSTEQQQQQLDSLTMRPALSNREDSPASSSYSSRETNISIVVFAEIEEIEQSNGDLSR